MFNYFIKRLLFSVLALFLLLLLVFFLMQAIPGYPIPRSGPSQTDLDYQNVLRQAGLLDNVFLQLIHFFTNLFRTGQFGEVYNGNLSVVETMINPIKYTLIIAGPAFLLASFFGIMLGVISAYYRGKIIDIIINAISVLFISIPSFIFALYLIQLAGLIGLPTQFIDLNSGQPIGKIILSMLTPILSMTLSSISVIIYYTRNELVEVFKQDYIKTALAKGMSFRQVVWKYALRNAMIPILSCLLPAFMVILSGSIIIEKFFNVPGTAQVIINAINQKEIYIIMFSTIFYSSIYFGLQILVDISFTFIDPRIVYSSNSSNNIYKKVKIFVIKKVKLFNLNHSNDNFKFLLNKKYMVHEAVGDDDNSGGFLTDSINLSATEMVYDDVVSDSITSENEVIEIDPYLFKEVNIYGNKFEQVSGKPTKYLTDLRKRFFKSKPATICTLVLLVIVLMSIIISLMNLKTINNAINSGVPPSFLSYLPIRIPWLGISGISDITVSNDIFQAMSKYHENFNGLYLNATPIGDQWFLTGYNPYVLPGMGNMTLLAGTDGLGRNWWNMLWISTVQSLLLAVLVSFFSVLIGTIYGSISGSRAGTMTDTVLMRIVEIISGVPLILWIMIIGLIISDGTLSLPIIGISLILVNWMWPAITARTYIIKYKDAEFIQAAKTLGASEIRIIFNHMLPNIAGRLFVRFVNMIPRIIFFESSLVFLGLRNSTDISLGTMIEVARLNAFPHLLIGPTLIIILITLCSQIISNNLNDSLDPRVSGE